MPLAAAAAASGTSAATNHFVIRDMLIPRLERPAPCTRPPTTAAGCASLDTQQPMVPLHRAASATARPPRPTLHCHSWKAILRRNKPARGASGSAGAGSAPVIAFHVRVHQGHELPADVLPAQGHGLPAVLEDRCRRGFTGAGQRDAD